MKAEDWLLLIAGGIVVPTIVAVHVFVVRRRVYPTWAKITAIIFCAAGIAWGILDYLVLNSRWIHVSHQAHDQLVGIRGLVGGVCIGIAVTLSLAFRKLSTASRLTD